MKDDQTQGINHDKLAGISMRKELVKKKSPSPEAIDRFASGVEDEDVGHEISEPFDPTKIKIDTNPQSLSNLLARMKNKEINLSPDFQRKGGIWNDGAQSRLIESLIIRIPIPAFYVDATDEDNWIVIDGLQRLTALKRFVIDKTLKLTELEFLEEIAGLTFNELPRGFQRRINETTVTVSSIKKGTPDGVKFNIFKRINTGGLPLSGQEIRNALNQGKATEVLDRLSKSTAFGNAVDWGISDKRMADKECILRFLAFTLTPYSRYKTKDFDAFLNNAMKTINTLPGGTLAGIESHFTSAMINCRKIFGVHAFRKRYKRNVQRNPINKALFEAWSTNIASLSEKDVSTLIKRKKLLMDKFIELMADRDFDQSVTQGTGSPGKVKTRFSNIRRIIKETIDDRQIIPLEL